MTFDDRMRELADRKSKAMVPAGFRIPQEIDKWAESVAKTHGISKSEPLRELLELGWRALHGSSGS